MALYSVHQLYSIYYLTKRMAIFLSLLFYSIPNSYDNYSRSHYDCIKNF